jgi:hypothetical protein
MKRMAWIALGLTVLIEVGMLAVLQHFVVHTIPIMPEAERLAYFKLAFEIFKAILVGFGAATLGILIPSVLTEARSSFERLKDSRIAYSEAKTAGDYAAARLCSLTLGDAVDLLQRAHVSKHTAELYPELKEHLKRRGILKTPAQWGDGLYNQYFTLRVLLEEHAAEWDNLRPFQRLRLIREVVPSPPKEPLVAGALYLERAHLTAESNAQKLRWRPWRFHA